MCKWDRNRHKGCTFWTKLNEASFRINHAWCENTGEALADKTLGFIKSTFHCLKNNNNNNNNNLIWAKHKTEKRVPLVKCSTNYNNYR